MENQNQFNSSNQGEQSPSPYNGPTVNYSADYKESPVTMKQWLLFWLVTLVNVVPVIGSIAYIIFILYVAFKKDSRFPVSMQNFCKAYLVVIAVGIALTLIFAGTLISMFIGMVGMGY